MSNVRPTNQEPIAIVCADLHLSHRPPLARSGEKNWYDAMANPLRELRALVNKLDVPVFCVGDIFDRWNSPPELISFAMDELPGYQMIVIPGQHDLPYHDPDALEKSALGVLIKAGMVNSALRIEIPHKAIVSGFGWGEEIEPPLERSDDYLKVALVHAYCWKQGASYDNSPKENQVGQWAKKLRGYNIAIFGDNHTPFEVKIGNLLIYNCGSFYRRHSNETHDPSVGILYADGTIKRHYLDTSQDVFTPSINSTSVSEQDYDEIRSFVQGLLELDHDLFDFKSHLLRVAEQEPRKGVQRLLRELADGY